MAAGRSRSHLVTGVYGGSVPGCPLRVAGVASLPTLKVDAAVYREIACYERASVYAAEVLEQLGAPVELVELHREAAAAESLDGRVARFVDGPAVVGGFLDAQHSCC